MSKPDRSPSSAINTAAQSQRLFDFLQPAVVETGLFLEEVNVHLAGTQRIVHVVVDLPEDQQGSVGLDKIAEVSLALSSALDADPEDDGRPFDLEVSSPGVGRPLTELRHWRRALGRMATLKLRKSEQGESLFGRIIEVSPDGVKIRPELPVKKGMKPKQAEPEFIEFAQIRKGTVEVEFHRLDEEEQAGTDSGQKGQD